MSEKTFNTRIIHKHDTETNWLKAVNFIPKQGELIIYDSDENYPYQRVKIGDGITSINDLPFVVEGNIYKQTEEPTNAIAGDLWIDLDERPAGQIYNTEEEPSDAIDGDIWVDGSEDYTVWTNLPTWTSADENKVLKIVNGIPTWVSLL